MYVYGTMYTCTYFTLIATASELSAITAVMDQTKIDILSFPSIQV